MEHCVMYPLDSVKVWYKHIPFVIRWYFV
jgi:hypothetical protein